MKGENNMGIQFEGENNDIIFSKVVKAGKRIYYLDVKKNGSGGKLVTITESKRVFSIDGDASRVDYEKHKVFIYPEAMSDFVNAMNEIRDYVVNLDNDIHLTDKSYDFSTQGEEYLNSQNSMGIEIEF